MFTLTNKDYDTAPIFEALVSQSSYVGIWVCSSPEDGQFYQVDYNFVGHMHPDDRAKSHPPRRITKGCGFFEDGLSRCDDRKPSVFVKTYAEAMKLVADDVAEHQLHKNVV